MARWARLSRMLERKWVVHNWNRIWTRSDFKNVCGEGFQPSRKKSFDHPSNRMKTFK